MLQLAACIYICCMYSCSSIIIIGYLSLDITCNTTHFSFPCNFPCLSSYRNYHQQYCDHCPDAVPLLRKINIPLPLAKSNEINSRRPHNNSTKRSSNMDDSLKSESSRQIVRNETCKVKRAPHTMYTYIQNKNTQFTHTCCNITAAAP